MLPWRYLHSTKRMSAGSSGELPSAFFSSPITVIGPLMSLR